MIYIDFETRSKVDLKAVGSWVYSQHPSTEVLCMAFTLDNNEIKIWKPEHFKDPQYKYLALDGLSRLLKDQQIEAHNAFFERAIWENIMMPKWGFPSIPADKWRCSAALAAYHAIPRSLEKAGTALDLAVIKDQSGKRVMMQLARPKAKTGEFLAEVDHADKYELLYEYCKQDVAAERAIGQALGELPECELKIWQLDQKINHRGVPMDREAITAALKMLNEYAERLTEEVVTISEGALKTIGQRAKVFEFCAGYDEEIDDYTKAGVVEALKVVKHPKVKRILEIRQALGKTSTAKYERMLNALPADDRIRDTLMYHGAATGRWAGKLVQFQNLPRGSVKIKDMASAIDLIKTESIEAIEMCYGDFMPFMSTAIRGMVKASEGKMLVVADFASIEARVLAWLSGCELMLQQFRDGVDLYKEMASKIYNVKPSEVTDEQRQLGKAAILGAGYGMGPAKFLDTCLSWGMAIDESLAKLAIYTYRETYPEVKSFWAQMENLAIRVASRELQDKSNRVRWIQTKDFLTCKLPSGRAIHYYKPEIHEKESQWGVKPALTFMGEKQGKTGGKTWMRVDTYGGKLVENITQAVARDLMAEAMLRVEDAGFEIVLSIHDELIAEFTHSLPVLEQNLSCETLAGVLEIRRNEVLLDFETLMSKAPSWAKGCPIEAKGWVGKHYKK